MEHWQKNNDSTFDRIMGKMAAEKKKTVFAICLITVMVFMWIRVLGGKGPDESGAAVTAQQAAGQKPADEFEMEILPVELPEVKGRNDELSKDFFSPDDQSKASASEVKVDSESDNEELVKQIAAKLQLEAIISGKNRQAFINNEIYNAGDNISIVAGENSYNCEVIEIKENEVLMRFEQSEIKLKLAQESATGY